MSQRRVNRSTYENTCSTEVVNECVKYLICREGSKIPIKLTEIDKHLSTVFQTQNTVKTVIEKANIVLKNVYGYKLLEVTGKQYILVLNKPCESLLSTFINPQHRKLLVAALIHIYMTGLPVRDYDMWKFLSRAGLLDEKDIPGRKILTNTFVKQLYLKYNKLQIKPGEQNKFEFEWGQRAEEELPKEFILQKMATAFNKEPRYWGEQFNATQKSSIDNHQ